MGMVLPMNYVEIEQEEMMYLDGGNWYISNANLKAILVSALGSGFLTIVTPAAIEVGIYGIAAYMASIPGLGWVTGALLAINAASFATNAANALIDGKGVRVRLGFPAGLRFSVE